MIFGLVKSVLTLCKYNLKKNFLGNLPTLPFSLVFFVAFFLALV